MPMFRALLIAFMLAAPAAYAQTPIENVAPLARGAAEPDPTVLTTAALLREIGLQEKLFVARLEVIITRLEAMDKALELLQEITAAQPTPSLVQSELKAQGDVMREHFDSIDAEFLNVYNSAAAAQTANATAINAALLAQKEAVAAQDLSGSEAIAKSEVATAEALEQLRTLGTTENKALEERVTQLTADLANVALRGEVEAKLEGLEGQVDALAAQIQGAAGQGAGRVEAWQILIAALGALGILFGIFMAVRREGRTL